MITAVGCREPLHIGVAVLQPVEWTAFGDLAVSSTLYRAYADGDGNNYGPCQGHPPLRAHREPCLCPFGSQLITRLLVSAMDRERTLAAAAGMGGKQTLGRCRGLVVRRISVDDSERGRER